MNKVFLIGRVTKEFNVKVNKNGKKYMIFSLAVQRDKENVDFFPISVWEQAVDYLTAYAHKGTLISVEGRLTTIPKPENDKLKDVIIQSLNLQILSQPLAKDDEPQPMIEPKAKPINNANRYQGQGNKKY